MHCQNLLFDPARIPSPCFVLDEAQLQANAAILNTVQERTGAKILLALKGYAAWATFPLLSRSGRKFWLVYPKGRRNRPAIRKFRAFLLDEIAADPG